jgi:2-keto-4-pentenoate hydratase/2-oxohepta-3-ene-1,7-dioic acid hydratase in catechol pathway
MKYHGGHQPAVEMGEETIGLLGAGFHDLRSIIAGGADAMDRVIRWADRPPSGDRFPTDKVQLLAPIPRPPKIICIGLNYRDHAAESNMAIPQVPTVFCKFPTSVIGPGDPIVLPKASTQPDYEAEFAVVIGRGGRHIAAADWKKHVFGYTIVHDVSARDF